MNRKFLALVVVVIMSALMVSCGGGDGTPTTSISVEMTDFAFTPTTFTIAAGQEITLTAINNGTVEHEFVIMKLGTTYSSPFDEDDEGNVYWEVEVMPGATQTTTFTAPSEPGEYQLLCGLPAHAEAGMISTITVK